MTASEKFAYQTFDGFVLFSKLTFIVSCRFCFTAGLEDIICSLVMDLEERDASLTASEHGPLGKPVRNMDWEEICLWLEQMGARDVVVDLQREQQHSGQDIEHMIQKPWKYAIDEVFMSRIKKFCFAFPS